jgi:hypothetical protein
MQAMMSNVGNLNPNMMQQAMQQMSNMSPADMAALKRQADSMDPAALASQTQEAQKMMSAREKYAIDVSAAASAALLHVWVPWTACCWLLLGCLISGQGAATYRAAAQTSSAALAVDPWGAG